MSLCTLAGFAVSQVQPGLVENNFYGIAIGFGLGGLLIAIDEMLKGFSLRAFSAATFGLMLGSLIAWLIDHSGLFVYVDEASRWLIRLCLFVSFSYIGMVLAMRSNKEDFSLIIPYVRFASQQAPMSLLVLDTSVIIDGRIAELLESKFIEGTVVIPRFVLKELQLVADSSDAIRRARGRRGLETLARIRKLTRPEIKIHDGDFPEETTVDAKLIKLCHALGAKLFTNDFNLGKVAELQNVGYLNLNQLASALKTVLLPGESLNLKIVREGKDKGQGVGYMNDGTMVVVNHAASLVGQSIDVQVQSLLQTGAGVIVFADIKAAA
ncbi:MAG TPA: PIN domain-containing protein [Verrucomicrobiae bacterium]